MANLDISFLITKIYNLWVFFFQFFELSCATVSALSNMYCFMAGKALFIRKKEKQYDI